MASDFESVARWRVTPENPPRDIEGLDYERCAALHNFIFTHAWTSYGLPAGRLHPPSWWTYYADEAETLRPRLHPSVVEFLQRAHVLPHDSGLSFFKYLDGLNVPSMLWFVNHFGEESRFLTLYNTHAELGSNPDGLVYDQADHTVHMNFSIEDLAGELEHMEWLKLETVLSIYIDMMERGKAVALPSRFFADDDDPSSQDAPPRAIDAATGACKPRVAFARPWVVVPYAKADLEDTLSIWNDLVEEIEKRMPDDDDDAREAAPQHGLVDAESLTAASIPPDGFAHHLLSRARRPRFAYVAPGMRLPTLEEFVAQPYRDVVFNEKDDPEVRKPVRLFVIDEGDHDPITSEPPGWPYNLLEGEMPCGLYLDHCDARGAAPWEDAVLVRLPFEIATERSRRREDGSAGPGLWEMDGVEKFGGWHRAQLLAVLENMYVNVKEGHWRVDGNGVAGGVEVFRDADVEEVERWYRIPVGPGRFW